jgi:hypothetical protein
LRTLWSGAGAWGASGVGERHGAAELGTGARAPTSKGDDKGAELGIRPSGHRLVAPKRASEVDTPG